ncbi:MAG: J domain-containing protein [Spirochaetaceae bacterium]|nr:MAG: J domain-containing protein [Spirochaetaceae bacterium]
MDVFDRLGNILRDMLDTDETVSRNGDSDFTEAWSELDAYLSGGEEPRSRTAGGTAGGRNSTGTMHKPRSLLQDYKNLEVGPDADIEAVRKSYTRLLKAYHPDRHAGNSEKQQTATEITKQLNESFRRIKQYLGRTE